MSVLCFACIALYALATICHFSDVIPFPPWRLFNARNEKKEQDKPQVGLRHQASYVIRCSSPGPLQCIESHLMAR